tara:strand:+ start:51 stop:278 length:228 start_codon:yes stop_codon:yes gene_type:complete
MSLSEWERGKRIMKEFIKEIKDTHRQENKTYKKETNNCDKHGCYEMSDEDFYRVEGWVEALEYVLKLAKTKGLDK